MFLTWAVIPIPFLISMFFGVNFLIPCFFITVVFQLSLFVLGTSYLEAKLKKSYESALSKSSELLQGQNKLLTAQDEVIEKQDQLIKVLEKKKK